DDREISHGRIPKHLISPLHVIGPMDRSSARRILIVDDEVSARTALAALLRIEGYEVETAADAFKCLGKYETFEPDVVVTDLKMPGMDGIELVKRIRGLASPADVMVV